jgi:hypothetical protein
MTPKPKAPNEHFAMLRQHLPSRNHPGRCISQSELAEAVNQALIDLYPDLDADPLLVDNRWIGSLERGQIRSARPERVKALLRVFSVDTAAQLGLLPVHNIGTRRSGAGPNAVPTRLLATTRQPRRGDGVYSPAEDAR